MSFSAADHAHMALALRLAARGLFTTTPNPRVGCVLVKEEAIVGVGWHEKAGGPHAEVNALAMAGSGARGATAYVTLEPCSHYGRTPPCADALIAAGVSRVVAAMVDPNPLVAGQGLDRLRAAGIAVETGLLESEARELNLGFVSRMTRGRPWLRLKIATSLDGKTALANGQSQWITGPAARRDVQAWRARSCAILTGSGTVLQDNPRLSVREIDCPRQPLRVVADSRLRIPEDAALLSGGPCLIASAKPAADKAARLAARGIEVLTLPDAQGRVDLAALLAELARRGCNEVLAEAGAHLAGALVTAGLVDEFLLYQAPLLLGDAARGMVALGELSALAQAPRLAILERRAIGADLFIRARCA
ncbi:MAG: bifunctional diaminohydroxyphosphoribosylaminopyrimidine deaminase/5-amino-6-(5-phosphoribosylamino)uracil reductase RibD [Rhodocyclaceae bacterium]|nr:bifunctional diaminohydroxyphosphoribosylaminopyrimidine deaminase/5-amino-6-(5-phosphoribosylamino)uracil reductase RibD [Rhodocyclaceae bacterium]